MNPLVSSNVAADFAPAAVLIPQVGLLAVGIMLLFLVWRMHSEVWGRPAFVFAVLMMFFYQIPSILYGGHLFEYLPNAIWFVCVVNALPICLCVWLLFVVRSLSPNRSVIRADREIAFLPNSASFSMRFVFLAAAAAVGVYFFFIPWGCTGLWAFVHDPAATLLAREVSMKLSNSPWANRAYGTYVNVLGPLICSVSLFVSTKLYLDRQLFRGTAWLIVAFLSIPFLYVAGIKGALASAGLFVAASILAWWERPVTKVAAAFICSTIFVGSILGVETLRERESVSANIYDFARCAQSFGSCDAASRLIASAAEREAGALGISQTQLREYGRQLESLCARLDKTSDLGGSAATDPTFGTIVATYPRPQSMVEVVAGWLVAANSAVAAETIAAPNFNLRNKVVNGNFDYWGCEEETYAGSSFRFGCASLWRYFARGGNTGKASYSRKFISTTAGDAPELQAGNYLRWHQVQAAEGSSVLSKPVADVRTLAGSVVTLSFYARADSERVLALQLVQNFGSEAGGGLATGFPPVQLTTKWQKFSRTVFLPPAEGRVIEKGSYLDIQFAEPSSSTFVIDIARVQLEEGAVATPFEVREMSFEEKLIGKQSEILKFLDAHDPRARELLKGLGGRLFILPLQVASWHYLYALDKESLGWQSIPIVDRFSDRKQNIAELVYQRYGARYSVGDMTSTSTAPTSSAFSYSAHLGVVGLAVILLLLIAFDALCAKLYLRLTPPFCFAFAGFVATASFNLISSDFFTVMFSHGGLFGLCLFGILAWIGGREDSKSLAGNSVVP